MKPEFSAAQTPLEKGFTVIEASAGTGKTTTIAAIVLRLLVEQGIPIEQILVTTYTELATAELRGRIRDTIADALTREHLPFVHEIIKKVTDRKQFERRLKLALQSFDEAPIFTIHGFCARVLADRAFESGVLFETELVTDQSRFVHEVVDDFWRAHFYSDDSIMAGVVRERLVPARLVELLVQLTNNPTLRVSPPSENRAALTCSRDWTKHCGARGGNSCEKVCASVSPSRWWMSSKTPIRCSIRSSRRFMAVATGQYFLSAIPNRRSMDFAARTFLLIWKRQKLRIAVTPWSGIGVRRRSSSME